MGPRGMGIVPRGIGPQTNQKGSSMEDQASLIIVLTIFVFVIVGNVVRVLQDRAHGRKPLSPFKATLARFKKGAAEVREVNEVKEPSPAEVMLKRLKDLNEFLASPEGKEIMTEVKTLLRNEDAREIVDIIKQDIATLVDALFRRPR